MKKNKITIILIVIAIIIIATICILFGKNDNNTDINAPIINIGDQNNDLNNDINEENDDVNNEEEEEEINYQKVELNKKKETYEFDKLHLEFTGTPTGEDYFKYLLNIKYNGKKIESTFFNDNKNYRIYSSEMAADFRIYKIEDVYVLVSSIARQCLGSEAIVFNTDGKVLKTFAMAEISVEDNIINVSTSSDDNCMDLNNYKNSKYKVSGKTITEQK